MSLPLLAPVILQLYGFLFLNLCSVCRDQLSTESLSRFAKAKDGESL